MGAYVVFKLQGEKNFKRAPSMVFYCEARRISGGRLHGYFIVRQGGFQEGS
jgi:hypothetical protein